MGCSGEASRGRSPTTCSRADRRIHDIAEAMAERGQQWPEHRSLYRDRDADIEAAAKAFSVWYARRHGSEPHRQAIR